MVQLCHMRLAIIATKKTFYSIGRISEEARDSFKEIDIYNWKDLSFFWNKSSLEIRLKQKSLENYSHIITRVSDNYFPQRYILAQECEDKRIYFLNQKMITKLALYNKMTQYYFLQKAGLPIVPTYQAFQFANIKLPFEYPVVVKGIQGKQARQVWKANSQGWLKKYLENQMYHESLVQPFLKSGSDIRIIVIGGKIIASYKRISKKSFKTIKNGEKQTHSPSREESRIAVNAAKALESEYAGVDIMETDTGPAILEVNIDAGFKVLEKISGKNVAKPLVEYIAKK